MTQAVRKPRRAYAQKLKTQQTTRPMGRITWRSKWEAWRQSWPNQGWWSKTKKTVNDVSHETDHVAKKGGNVVTKLGESEVAVQTKKLYMT